MLTLEADATYLYTGKVKGRRARTDLVVANGVTISGATSFRSSQGDREFAAWRRLDCDQQHEREPDQRHFQQPT